MKYVFVVLVLALTACTQVEFEKVQGLKGETGDVGAPGSPGTPGASCSVQAVVAGPLTPNGGARITCSDGTDTLLVNGSNGTNGTDGADGADAPTVIGIQQVVKPCPTLSGSFPELFLILSDRTVIASFSANQAGSSTRLSAITPGSYVTTDGRSCAVTVTATTISWAGGSVTY